MHRTATALAAALSIATAACNAPPPGPAPSTPSPPAATANTATFDPLETIEARRLLMVEAERQIKPIDLYTLGTPAEPAAMRAAAVTIETLMLALPHLFAPDTNLFDPTTREPPTIALPGIWENWASFQQMALNAERAAGALSTSEGDEALIVAARNLRASCDACHQAFTKPYVPPKATDEDRNFDFDQFLPPK